MKPLQPVDTSLYDGQALITFTYDDGRRGHFDTVLPLHAEFNIAAGFAIIAERAVDEKFRGGYMGLSEVSEARGLGVEIYSHAYSHRKLTAQNDAELDFELRRSREILSIPGGTVTSICIPYSAADARVLAAAHEYYPLVRVHGRKFTPVFAADGNPVVYSFGLTNQMQPGDVKALIDKAVREKAWLTLMLHGIEQGPEKPQNPFNTTAGLLRETLAHVKEQGSRKLLPINLSDIHKIRARL